MKPGIINTEKMSPNQIGKLIDWLRANNIRPEQMPKHQKIVITGQRITYAQVKYEQRRRGGKRPVIGKDDFFQRETKTARIRVPYEAIR